jgi:hypothetical protein
MTWWWLSVADSMMKRGMFSETRRFVDQAEAIENWNHEELLQAGRNVWTCFGLQMIIYNEEVRLQDAYVGYSLLYPYTDNYLDDETIPKETKLTFQVTTYSYIHIFDIKCIYSHIFIY